MQSFKFEVIHTSKKSRARVGKIYTPNGIIDTPNFVGVGTNGAMKALDSKTVEDLGLQLMFANTYHLMLQPGTKLIKEAGGIHKFMNRSTPIITDSGGFQVFSLAYGGITEEIKSKGTKKGDNSVLKINEEGVTFRSYRDGSKILLTPETSIAAQKELGANIMISFDELPPYHISEQKLLNSFNRTHRWEERSLKAHLQNRNNQALYAVIHGGINKELRQRSCEILSKMDFDGFAIGGSVGKNREEMVDMLNFLLPHVPTDRPNHLLGIADLPSLAQTIHLGIDTFDSAHPTKAARHGLLFTKKGPMRATQQANKTSFLPIEEDCTCYTCKHYSRAYLCHLFKANELTAYTLASIHNLNHMIKLMESYRNQILNDQL